MLKKLKNKLFVSACMLSMFVTSAFAAGDLTDPAYAPTSLIPAEGTTVMTNIAKSMPLTVLAMLVIIIPAGLGLWGLGLAMKKGINSLQKRASKAM